MLGYQEGPCYGAIVAQRSSDSAGWGGRRRGAGRKSEMKEPVSMTLEVEREHRDALRAIAEAKGTSAARIVRDAIRAYLKRKGSV